MSCNRKNFNCFCEPNVVKYKWGCDTAPVCCNCCLGYNCWCNEKDCDDKHEHKPHKKSSAQFVSGLNFLPPYVGQEIIGYWPLGNVQPVEFGITAIADEERIKLSGNNTVILQPGRYEVATHVLVANFDDYDPQGSDPIVTKLFLNGLPLEYTTNSVDVINQQFVVTSTQLNKTNIIDIVQPNTTLQWMAGNTISVDFHFDLYEASIAIVEI
ncbi:MAG: hypothetical protein ACK5MV_13265 [Aminipila sp.]